MQALTSTVGTTSKELARDVHIWWQAAAETSNIDISGFAPGAPLDERVAWALAMGLQIGTVYTRFSSKRQHSTGDQVRTCVQHAASKRIYCPPEFICIDEAQHGYRTRREGLNRMKQILHERQASVLLVFKASRLYRQAFKGYQLIQQEVVEEGLRAISVTQGIDTADTKAWRMLFQVHGIVDDMVIEATSDHVRAGLKGLFTRGFTTGALPVGYRRKELPDAPQTNRGLPRTIAEIDCRSPDSSGDEPDVAAMIVQHFTMIRDGMPIRQGWMRWVADGGPTDPRSTKKCMSYHAYRRMLSRVAYTGRWEFGRKRNAFSTKRDYAQQISQPESEVAKFHCEELRIIDDELFFAVQRRLAELKQGPRGPRQEKVRQIWDLVVELFWCANCQERFYQTGAGGKGMQCKNGSLCPCKTAVRREEAVRAVCGKLCEMLQQDAGLIERIICRAREIDACGDEQLRAEVTTLERKITALSRKINDLLELTGQGSDVDRKEVRDKLRATQAERTTARHELSRLKMALGSTTATITPESVRHILADFGTLLQNAAAGKLGSEAVYKAVAVFKALVGGRIWVRIDRRSGRKRTNVTGIFRPALINTVRFEAGQSNAELTDPPAEEVSVWLREPPLRDRLASRVQQLLDVEDHSYRSAAKLLQAEGHNINSGVVWQIYRRYYEMIDQPVPKRPYNNGRKRRSR